MILLFALLGTFRHAQGENMSQALEISTFKVIEGTSAKAVIDTANALNEILKGLGMVSRTLSYDETNNLWADVILWKSSETAKAAPDIMMQQHEAGAFFALMISESITMQHLTVISTS